METDTKQTNNDTDTEKNAKEPTTRLAPLVGKETIGNARRVYVAPNLETHSALAALGLPCVCPAAAPDAYYDITPLLRRQVALLRDHADDGDWPHGLTACLDVATNGTISVRLDLVGLVRDLQDAPATQETARLVQRIVDEATNHGRVLYGVFWERPKPIEPRIPVPRIHPGMLPDAFRTWVFSAGEQMGAPVDFLAIGAITAAGAVIGRQCGIYPKARAAWLVVPNLWGLCVGPPSIGKSPALDEALAGIRALEEDAEAAHAAAMADYRAQAVLARARANHARKQLERAPGAADAAAHAEAILSSEAAPPQCKRYRTTDPTVEALGELLQHNPNGLLLCRDELMAWLRTLEKVGHEADRAWYLEAWSGLSRGGFDRIGRGTGAFNQIISILGNATPGALSSYVADACTHGDGADGLLQRFQLAVFPDAPPPAYVDDPPDARARQRFVDVFRRLADLRIPAEPGALPALRFSPEAQQLYRDWWVQNRNRVQDPKLPEALQAHFAKYDGLAPALALVNELVDGGTVRVGVTALRRAIVFCGYLSEHAMRIYAMGATETDAAAALARRLETGELASGFTAREVARKHWRGLRTRAQVDAAIERLEAAHWIRSVTRQHGGRPTTVYEVNPEVCDA